MTHFCWKMLKDAGTGECLVINCLRPANQHPEKKTSDQSHVTPTHSRYRKHSFYNERQTVTYFTVSNIQAHRQRENIWISGITSGCREGKARGAGRDGGHVILNVSCDEEFCTTWASSVLKFQDQFQPEQTLTIRARRLLNRPSRQN